MRIAVMGGTGAVGRYVVEEAQRRGHDASSHSRSSGADLSSGAGVDDALAGADCVVDASNVLTLRRAPAMAFFEASAKHLQGAAQRQGVAHVVVLSIVGIDQFRSLGYYDAKVTQERLHLDGVVPATVLRATQFHEFCRQVVGRGSLGPVAFVPSMRVQTVAARSVAGLVLDAAEGGVHRGRLADVAGPAPSAMLPSRARAALAKAGAHVKVVAIPLVGSARKAGDTGALLPAADGRLVGPTFESWLDSPDGPAPG